MFLFFLPALTIGTSFAQMYFTGKQFNSTSIIVYGVGTTCVVIFFATIPGDRVTPIIA